jgi:hypothetical protein
VLEGDAAVRVGPQRCVELVAARPNAADQSIGGAEERQRKRIEVKISHDRPSSMRRSEDGAPSLNAHDELGMDENRVRHR